MTSPGDTAEEVPTIEAAKEAYEKSWGEASEAARKAIKFIMEHCYVTLETRAKDDKLFQSCQSCYIKFLGENIFCRDTAAIMDCIRFYSDLENIIHNQSNDGAHRKKRQRVLRKDTEDKIARFYFNTLSWMRKLMQKDPKAFRERMKSHAEKVFEGGTRAVLDNIPAPSRVNVCPTNLRQAEEEENYQCDENFDFFSSAPLVVVDYSDVTTIAM